MPLKINVVPQWVKPLPPIIIIMLGGLMCVGCEGSCGGGLQSGRAVNAYSDTIWLYSESTADTATIKTPGKTILVQPTAILVDGVKVADIDENVADVRVRIKRGDVSIVADGVHIKTLRR
jgi:hypothetical protein